jgi:hypothetical protein
LKGEKEKRGSAAARFSVFLFLFKMFLYKVNTSVIKGDNTGHPDIIIIQTLLFLSYVDGKKK